MKSLLLFLLLFCSVNLSSLYGREGGNGQVTSGKCATINPSDDWEEVFQKQIQDFIRSKNLMRTAATIDTPYTIPVIVHVIYGNNSQNISQNRINYQIAAMNRGFNAQDNEIGNVPSYFQSVIGNPKINFCLATQDPNGNILATPGVERINATARGWNAVAGLDRNFMENTVKQNTIWDPNYYFNIWVCNLVQSTGNGGVVIAYAAFPPLAGLDGLPTGSINTKNDGVVCNYLYFGNGFINDYKLGKSLIHETGHWLGLKHIWGDDDQIYDPALDSIIDLPATDPRTCEGSDYVDDTPNSAIKHYSCSSSPQITCNNGPNGDMYMNYMDYSTDVCLNMFTKGQTTRMWTAIQNSPLRANVVKSKTCSTNPIKPDAKFTESTRGICPGQSVTFKDVSLFKPTSWKWTFEGGTPSSSTSANPTVVYNTAPGSYDVTLIAENGAGKDTIYMPDYITVVGVVSLPVAEDFEGSNYPPAGWSFVTRNNKSVNWDTIATGGLAPQNNTSIYWDNTSVDATGFKDDIRTPKMNFVGAVSPKLSFYVAHAAYPDVAYKDTLEVLISTDCGNTFTSIYKKGGDQLKTAPDIEFDWIPETADQWRKDSVSLTAFNGNPEVMVVFRNIAKFGHSIYLDNINISDLVSSPPVAKIAEVAATICQGQTITLQSVSTGSPTSVSWNFGGGGTPNTSTAVSPVVAFNSIGTFTITLTATNSAGSSTVTKTLVVVAKPNVAVDNATICNGESVTLTATGASTYAWTPGGSSDATITVSPTTNTTYRVIGTATNTCTDTAFSTVTVNTKPTADAGSDKVITCTTTSVQLGTAGVAGNTYNWSPSPGLSNANIAQPTATAAGTYRVIVTTTATGCKDTDEVVVTQNNALPNANAGNDKMLTCTNPTAQLNGSSTTSGISYSWAGVGIVSGGGTATPTVNAAGSYTLTVTNPANGCTSTDQVVVSSNIVAPTADAGSDKVITCTTPSVQLGTAAVAGNSYSWLPASGLSNAGIAQPTATIAATYTVTVMNTASGCTATDVVVVTSNTIAPTVNTSGATICTGQSVQLTATGNGSGYSWTGAGIVSGGNTATPTVNAAGTYTVTATNAANGCTATATAVVTINNNTPTITVNNATICSGESVTLTASGASTYTWNTGQSGASITVSPIENATYTATGSTGCNSGTGSSTVTVNPKPDISVNDASGCPSSSQTLTASGATTYTWSNGSSGGSISITVGSSNSTVQVIGTSTGCKDTATAQITSLPVPATPSITRLDSILTCMVTAASYQWYKDGAAISGATSQTYKMPSNGQYKVEVKNVEGCSAESAVLSVISLPIKHNTTLKDMQIIPNPNKGTFEVRIESSERREAEVVMYSVSGQKVWGSQWQIESGMNSYSVFEDQLPQGMYYLQINSGGEMNTLRIVIQK